MTPLTKIRRERVLPAPGEVLVKAGDRVEPTQVVARTEQPGDFRIVQVARLIDVTASKLKDFLQVKAGDKVEKGQVIAKRGWLPPRTVKSPIDGTVTARGGGRVLIEGPSTRLDLRAYINGTVTNVVAPYGLVIETSGALVQGIWGSGGESFGVLKCIVESPDQILNAQDIDPSCHSMILVGGAGIEDLAVIEQAQEFQVRGIILGGISAHLVPDLEDTLLPVVVTEGIGVVPMASPIFKLLQSSDGRDAAISGRVRSRWNVIYPEIIIPLPAESLPTQVASGEPLKVGTQVRLVRSPHMGAIGIVLSIPETEQEIATGAKVRVAKVDLGHENPVIVPLVNLEVLR
ncbi:MAG TPA: hypothetical protein ENN19_00900 [Chloroflexi bacterium]|nr:hypothetical protein [Chloroflexota bacterium]